MIRGESVKRTHHNSKVSRSAAEVSARVPLILVLCLLCLSCRAALLVVVSVVVSVGFGLRDEGANGEIHILLKCAVLGISDGKCGRWQPSFMK